MDGAGRGGLLSARFHDLAPMSPSADDQSLQGPVAALREHGLLAPMAGGNVIRLLPPLTATADELAAAVKILREVFSAFV